MASKTFDAVYGSDHPSVLDVLDLARKDAMASKHYEWADKLAAARKQVDALMMAAHQLAERGTDSPIHNAALAALYAAKSQVDAAGEAR